MSTCDLHADAVGAAFSALEPEEDLAFRAHLAHCAACRRTLAAAAEIVAALGAAVPQTDPPPALRGRLLETVRAERGREPSPPTVPPSAPPSTPAPARRPVLATAGALVAAVVLGLVLVVAGGVLPTRSPVPDTPVTATEERADRVVADARAADPGVRATVLRGETGAPVAVLLDPGDPTAGVRLVALDLPSTGTARDYVVWATGLPGNAPEAVAVMDPDDGVTRPLGDAPAPGPGTPAPRGWAVSVEASGPVPPRPSTVVAVGLVAG
ncbi:zf-HC2 domain-containing protein [Actinomycetospora straminea]|uniref:Anti-sigma-K factor RskA n=1 Tax=Actinomycetospora straminea TaxID=663607 RepID=A0ABP9EDK7_9PSEU|nr:zf-HC2 domain-containing protein [Actinomycetospora straminea]MDD7934540.1 zf-HC2 domain-containing protein [Actinomycetospora straminea]